MLPRAAAHVFVPDLEHPVLDEDDAHHLARVLRLRAGEPVTVSDGAGAWRLGRFVGGRAGRERGGGAGGPGAVVEPDGPLQWEAAPAPTVTVAFAPTKGDRPEWVVQKLTEAGVDRVVPFVASRSVVRWEAPRAQKQVERLRRVAREAAMQCRRTWLPEVADLTTFAALTSAPQGSPRTSAHTAASGGPTAVMAEAGGGPPSLERPTVLVGPEGGWDVDEAASDLPRVGLGPHVLRAETAAVAAGVLLSALRSQLVRPAG